MREIVDRFNGRIFAYTCIGMIFLCFFGAVMVGTTNKPFEMEWSLFWMYPYSIIIVLFSPVLTVEKFNRSAMLIYFVAVVLLTIPLIGKGIVIGGVNGLILAGVTMLLFRIPNKCKP